MKSKIRVTDHGEVYTRDQEVNAMLDLVLNETARIESRFLEPACGTGNFLIEVLDRKLQIVESRYSQNQIEFERYAILAVSSIYGIDLLPDNLIECRRRLFELFDQFYNELFGNKSINSILSSVKYILLQNIICGDALTLKTIGDEPQPIIFPEWSLVNGNMIKRRDFTFQELVDHESMKELPMFSDLGEDVFIPSPIKEYPLVKISDIYHVENY